MRTSIPWKIRLKNYLGELPDRIRYTRKSTEQEDRQAHSHEQQDSACNRKWGPIESLWIWRDSQSGRSFDRDGFQDLVDFCKAHPRPKSDPGHIEMWDPARFGRIVDETGRRPDLGVYIMMYLTLEQCGWHLRFVTMELTGDPQIDYAMIANEATAAATRSTDLAADASRGKRSKAENGYWPHAIPPFGAQKFDVRLGQVVDRGDLAAAKGVGGIILVQHEKQAGHWKPWRAISSGGWPTRRSAGG